MKIAIRSLVMLLSVALAICVALSTQVIANQVKAPSVSAGLGWAPETLAKANIAYNGYALRLERNRKATITARDRALAMTTYKSEPLAVPALALLETTPKIAAEPAENLQFLTLTSDLSRRSAYVNRRLADIYGRQGNQVQMFRWLGRTAKTNRQFEQAYVGLLATVITKPGAVEGMAPIIGKNPPWREEFWRLTSANKAALGRGAELRRLIIGEPWRQTRIGDDEARLLAALSAAGLFDPAQDLSVALASANGIRTFKPGMQLVNNAEFRGVPLLMPFDWMLSVNSDLVVSVYPRERGLVIGAIAGASGTAARQAVNLRPGSYTLDWSAKAPELWGAKQVAARLRCAVPGVATPPIDPLFLDAKTGSATMTVPESACRWYWLSLDIAVPDDDTGFDIVVTRLSLAPGKADPVAETAPAVREPMGAARPL